MSTSLCQRISKMRSELEVILNKKKAGTFTNQDMLKFIKDNNLNFKNEVNINQQNVCLNLASAFSQQYAGIKDSCVKKVEDICNRSFDNPIDYDNCYERLMPKLEDIKQVNQSEIVQNCEITSLLNSDLTKDNEELALTLNMMLGKFEPDCSKITQLDLKGDVQKFTKELNICINQAISNQRSVLEGCYMNNVNQSNFSNIMQSCTIKNEKGVSTIPEQKKIEISSSPSSPTSNQTTPATSSQTTSPTSSQTTSPTSSQSTPTSFSQSTPAPTPSQATSPTSSSNTNFTLYWIIFGAVLIFILSSCSFSLMR